MARLEPLTDKVIGAHGENHPELHQIGELFQRLCADLKPHMFKEEQILFPYILEMESEPLSRISQRLSHLSARSTTPCA